MKRWIVYLLPLLLCACQGSKMRSELQRVDSLNSSDALLDTITTMPEVVDYFDLWGSDNERMTAHYLLGCVFRDQNNTPMALRCYRDAVSYADTTANDCDYRRLSRIYGQMADLFHRQRAPRLEIEAERKAVEYAWKAKDTLAAVIFYGSLCGPYHMLNDMDSVLIVIEQLTHTCEAVGMKSIVASYQTLAADVYLRKKDYESTQKALVDYEQHAEYFDKQGNIDGGREIYYYYKGSYYEHTGLLDSAEYYYRKLYAFHKSHDDVAAAYHGLFSLYCKKGSTDSVAKYARLYCQANDSASFRHSADELTRTQALYNYEEHERIAANKTQEAERYRQAVFLLIVILSVAGYTSYQYEISQLIQQLSLYQDTPLLSEHWHIEQTMLDSPVISDLHHIACQAKVASSIQLRELREFVAKKLPDFFEIINSKDALLTPQELSICILIRLQFSQGELSALFGVSKQRINNIKRSINRKLFKSDGAATLNDNILSLCKM